jgi:hypothetical protein
MNYTQKFFIPYISYVLYFLGIGLFSGSLVHFSTSPTKYAIIAIASIIVFFVGAYLQEVVVSKKDIAHKVLVFIFSNLLLSLGIGFMSGGAQHFTDIPTLAPYYICIGLISSVVGYIYKFDVQLHKKDLIILVTKFLFVVIPLFLILALYANTLPKTDNDHHSEKDSNYKTMMSDFNTVAPEKKDDVFLQEMIRHHMMAVMMARQLLDFTKQEELKNLGQNIISSQSVEISTMQQLLKK